MGASQSSSNIAKEPLPRNLPRNLPEKPPKINTYCYICKRPNATCVHPKECQLPQRN